MATSKQYLKLRENGHNLPDIDNLLTVAQILKMPYSALVGDEKSELSMNFRSRLFHENNMFTRVKTVAQMEKLPDTLAALVFMREKHNGQFRKGSKFAAEAVEYINHPLMMACHAFAMGIRDDAVIAAILLHDVVEDTGTRLEELPVSEETKQIVDLVTFRILPGKTKEESKKVYYEKIMENQKACLVKVIDRCNNVSTMAGCFSREKLADYIDETETYILPVLTKIKNSFPAYGDAAFLVKYQIISLVESIKAMMA